MKIIKHGKKTEPKILRFECPKCGCVFEEYEGLCISLAIDGVKIMFSTECPQCGEECGRVDLSGKFHV